VRCTARGGERNTITSLNSRTHSASCSGYGHSLAVCVAQPRETEEGLDHVHEPLAGCDLHPYPRVVVARIPPVVPYAGLDDGRLALMQNAGLPVAFYGQLTLERGEALDLSGMAVFPYDTRADECGQLGSNSVVRILGSTSYISNEAVMQNWN
jgi:hypothetical protein